MLILGTCRAWKQSVLLGAFNVASAAVVVEGRRGSLSGRNMVDGIKLGSFATYVPLSCSRALFRGRSWSLEVAMCCSKAANMRNRSAEGKLAISRCGVLIRPEPDRIACANSSAASSGAPCVVEPAPVEIISGAKVWLVVLDACSLLMYSEEVEYILGSECRGSVDIFKTNLFQACTQSSCFFCPSS